MSKKKKNNNKKVEEPSLAASCAEHTKRRDEDGEFGLGEPSQCLLSKGGGQEMKFNK